MPLDMILFLIYIAIGFAISLISRYSTGKPHPIGIYIIVIAIWPLLLFLALLDVRI